MNQGSSFGMLAAIAAAFANFFDQKPTRRALESELRMRGAAPHAKPGRFRRRRAARPAGTNAHRRQYLPDVRYSMKDGEPRASLSRPSCPFHYARSHREKSRKARLHVIANNDRIENKIQNARLRKAGLA